MTGLQTEFMRQMMENDQHLNRLAVKIDKVGDLVNSLNAENKRLKEKLAYATANVDLAAIDNGKLKETILRLQAEVLQANAELEEHQDLIDKLKSTFNVSHSLITQLGHCSNCYCKIGGECGGCEDSDADEVGDGALILGLPHPSDG
jgi:predicted RNase H-like nuclease (RuvC/YqgF family)